MAAWFDWTVREFLERAASDAPTPGGGCAAALAGALGASMVCMVAALTRKKIPAGEERAGIEQILARGRELIAAFEHLGGEDMAAFEALIQAFRLPRGNEEEKCRRAEAVQEAVKRATIVPLEIARQSLATLELSLQVARVGSRNALSDAGVAAQLAAAALEAALLNVDINTPFLADAAFRDEMHEERDRLRRLRADLQAEVVRVIAGRLQEER